LTLEELYMRSSAYKSVKIIFRNAEVNIDSVQYVLGHVTQDIFCHFYVNVPIA